MNRSYHNDIQKHTYSIPDLVRTSIEPVYTSCCRKLDSLNITNLDKVVITGCGYSYAAALAVKDHLQEITHLPITVAPAIEVSRFSHACAGAFDGTLFIAISNSGSVSRINEAIALYKKYGAAVIGLTANMDGAIRNDSTCLLDTSSPSIGRSLPLRGYAMTILTLLAIGNAISLRKHIMTHDALADQIHTLCASMKQFEEYLPDIDSSVQEYIHSNSFLRSFEFVGAGHERASTFLGKIEMMGQAGLLASDEDCEQWCHCNFFMANPEKIGTILFLASDSPAASRTREALSYMLHLKRPVCVVTDDLSLQTNHEMQVVHLPQITLLNAGLLEMAVPSLLTGYICEIIGETYSRGFRDQWALFKDGCGTCESEIVIL